MLSMARQGYLLGYDIDCADVISFPFQYSRFIRQYYRLPDYRRDAQSFINSLIELCAKNKYSAAILIHDDMLELYMNYRDTIDRVINVICPPSIQQYELSHNKYSLLRYCEKISFSIPYSQLVNSIGELNSIIEDVKFPIIAKPASTAVLVNNHLVTLNVKKINDSRALIDFVREHINNTTIMLQEIIGGNGAGVNFISKDGKIIEKYIHMREREAFGGGVSSLRKTVGANHLGLFDLIDEFVIDTKWSGLGMMEFKIQNDVPYLMELNARPWGSIEAGVIGGYNIPRKFFLNFYEKENEAFEPIDVPKEVLVLNSKLDLQYSLNEAQRGKTLRPLLRWVCDTFFNNQIKVEDSLLSDFKFNSYNHIYIFINALKKRLRKLKKTGIVPVITKEIFQSKKKIGFVCFGNICRTPFAKIYAEKHIYSIGFYSFGLYTEPNRLPPLNAIIAANTMGINIEEHRSSVLTESICKKVDILLFMDEATYRQATELFPTYKNLMYKFNKSDIPDPYGTDVLNFTNTYKVIANCLSELF